MHDAPIVPVCEQTLGSTVPTRRDVLRVGLAQGTAKHTRVRHVQRGAQCLSRDRTCLEKMPLHDPKSASFSSLSMIKMFSGLMSRWKMPLRCMWSIAFINWYVYLVRDSRRSRAVGDASVARWHHWQGSTAAPHTHIFTVLSGNLCRLPRMSS